MILTLGYFAMGFFAAAIAKREFNRSVLYCLGLLFLWPLYIWVYFIAYLFYFGSSAVMWILR